MKTRKEIEKEYENQRAAISDQYYAKIEAARDARDAALAELDDPMARLIAAARGWRESHSTHFITNTNCKACDDFQSAIDYAEQRRARG